MSEKSLNQRIAEALGYSVKAVPSLEDKNRIAYYLYCDPAGEGVHYADDMISVPVTGYNEATAWERGNLDYEHSLDDVAAELPERMIIEFRPLDNGKILATFCDPEMETSSLWYGEGATRKEAAADALLAWALAQAPADATPGDDDGGRRR